MADYFDWATRTDRDGKPAGIYTTTPFPVTEASASYDIVNDENPSGKTFYTGTIYFVDGNISGSCADYDPGTRSCGAGSYTCYETIAAAIAAISSGNNTILIRSGTYSITAKINLNGLSGTDDTHRYSLIGYNQERPVIDGTSNGGDALEWSGEDYGTIQRVTVQNNGGRGFRSDPDAGNTSYISLIDAYFYNNCTDNDTDGNIHFFANATYTNDYAWLFHVTSEHTMMKGVKVSDHSTNAIIEWCVIDECGYWSGIGTTPFSHAYGFDAAADGTSTNNDNMIFRYNIVGQALFGNELRYCPNFSVHHNEFYDSVHEDDFEDEASSYTHIAVLSIRGSSSYGVIYSNIFRDNDDTEKPYLFSIVSTDNAVEYIEIYNNLFWNAGYLAYLYFSGTSEANVKFYNNSLYASNSNTILTTQFVESSNGTVDLQNNIFYQAGSGACLNINGTYTDHTYNRYYYPSGSRGVTLDTGEVDGDPSWIQIPSGSYDDDDMELQATDAGADQSGDFTDDFLGETRSAWDKGAKEYILSLNVNTSVTIEFS